MKMDLLAASSSEVGVSASFAYIFTLGRTHIDSNLRLYQETKPKTVYSSLGPFQILAFFSWFKIFPVDHIPYVNLIRKNFLMMTDW